MMHSPPLLRVVLALAFVAASPAAYSSAASRKQAPVEPAAAAPGQSVYIHTSARTLKTPSDALVTVGGRHAPVLGVVGGADVEILVPVLPPGLHPVVVFRNGKEIARREITVRDTLSRRYWFQFEGQELQMTSADPSNDAPTRRATTLHRRLSFDVVDANGSLMFTTAVLHPDEVSGEAFTAGPGGRDRLARVKPEAGPPVRVVLPNAPTAATIRVFLAPRGLDISTDAGRRQRSFVREFTLAPGSR